MKSYKQIIDDYIDGGNDLLFDLIMFYKKLMVVILGFWGALYYSSLFLMHGSIPTWTIYFGITAFIVFSFFSVYHIYNSYRTIKKLFSIYRKNDVTRG